MEGTTVAIVLIFVVLALIAVAGFASYRRRGYLEINGPFGFHLQFGGSSDEPPTPVGVDVEDIVAREGGVLAEDEGGGGVRVRRLDAKDDVILSSRQSTGEADPKEEPPA